MKFMLFMFIFALIIFTCSVSTKKTPNEIQEFRLNKMKQLQDRHTWYPSVNERMNDDFRRKDDRENNDKFVSFLKFVKSSSYDVNKVVLQKQIEKFLN